MKKQSSANFIVNSSSVPERAVLILWTLGISKFLWLNLVHRSPAIHVYITVQPQMTQACTCRRNRREAFPCRSNQSQPINVSTKDSGPILGGSARTGLRHCKSGTGVRPSFSSPYIKVGCNPSPSILGVNPFLSASDSSASWFRFTTILLNFLISHPTASPIFAPSLPVRCLDQFSTMHPRFLITSYY
jgi:hypothetical protein